jgi:hypothetical protein
LIHLVSWSIWNQWYKRTSTRRPETVAAIAAGVTTRQTTIKRTSPTTRVYIVNEIVNDGRKSPSYSDEQEDSLLNKLQLNASDPATFGINWERVPYDKAFSNRVASISKLLVLIIPILLVLLF